MQYVLLTSDVCPEPTPGSEIPNSCHDMITKFYFTECFEVKHFCLSEQSVLESMVLLYNTIVCEFDCIPSTSRVCAYKMAHQKG